FLPSLSLPLPLCWLFLVLKNPRASRREDFSLPMVIQVMVAMVVMDTDLTLMLDTEDWAMVDIMATPTLDILDTPDILTIKKPRCSLFNATSTFLAFFKYKFVCHYVKTEF
ncbi:hypothetical protein L9F63_012287, partial [Diploptera punctata]